MRIGSLLVAGEVALVVILLAGAGLMVKSFARLRSVELGLTPERVDFVEVSLPPSRYQRRAAYGFYTAVVLLLAGAALAATYLPARRASRVDPIQALRAGIAVCPTRQA